MNFSRVRIVLGSITEIECEAIVNAANCSLLGGGGVDGAIHRAAGLKLLEECRTLGGCKTGEAKITAAYKLKAKYIIHTPGPIYKDGSHNEAKLLASSYSSSLELAKDYKISSIAFPAISTGVYNFPKKIAVKIAFDEISSFCDKELYYPNIVFSLFDDENYQIYREYYRKVSKL